MVGGFSTPKKDKELKVSGGEKVKKGQILCRQVSGYKAGVNVSGIAILHADCEGKVSFSRKKTGSGKLRTYINVLS